MMQGEKPMGQGRGGASPLRLHDVAFSYGKSSVLADVSLTLDAGQVAVVAGENGAGKSTLARIILGELRPSSGNAALFGRPASSFDDWSRVGYVPQCATGTYDRFPATVMEVVLANRYAVARGLLPYSRKDRAAARAALGEVHLEGLERRLVGELSGGQLQRVLLARALVNEPDLLVLDEPTSGMDEKNVEAFVDLLGTIVRPGNRSVLLITHDLRRLAALDARRFTLYNGSLKEVPR